MNAAVTLRCPSCGSSMTAYRCGENRVVAVCDSCGEITKTPEKEVELKMTATERLRSLLDARGVGHTDTDLLTVWLNADGVECTAMESPVMYGRLCVALTCTPLEAVQATTGGELERRLERIERKLNHKGASA